ncbi:MAG TPA: NfeD family protein, partial [Zoogloea sp.]|nr:NfeD family protein [Zoogloea sp.]
GGAAVLWYLVKKKRPGDPSARADRSVNLDVGETVLIESWNSDGTASVKYRGATWTAIHRPGITPSTGMHRVSELVGNRLLVDPL